MGRPSLPPPLLAGQTLDTGHSKGHTASSTGPTGQDERMTSMDGAFNNDNNNATIPCLCFSNFGPEGPAVPVSPGGLDLGPLELRTEDGLGQVRRVVNFRRDGRSGVMRSKSGLVRSGLVTCKLSPNS